MSLVGQGILIFMLMFIVDIFFALYTLSVTRGRALAASCSAAMILLFNGIVTVQYVDKPVLLLCAVAGAFAGTWAVVRGQKESA